MVLNMFEMYQSIRVADVQTTLSLTHGHLSKLASDPF